MKKLPEGSVDLIVTDPPYFVLEKQEWDQQWSTPDEYFAWLDSVFSEMWRVLKDGGQMYVFFSQKFMFEYGIRYRPKRMLVWWHRNLSPPTNGMWLYQYDPIFYHTKGQPRVFNGNFSRGFNSDVLEYPKPQGWVGHETHHPTEKPVELVMRLVAVSSNEGDVVLDPFMGSGTTAVASLLLKRDFIGFEKSERYYRIAKERVSRAGNAHISAFF